MSKEPPVVDEVLPGLYRIEIPIPDNPLKAINSYVIKGRERNLIIDTGVNRRQAVAAMFGGLKQLGVDLNKTDLFATHLHVDHLGLVKKLATDSSRIFFNRREVAVINSDRNWQELYPWQEVFNLALRHGFPETRVEKTLRTHPGYTCATGKYREITIVGEGDILQVGDFSFRCVETPGHSPGHICLYEEGNKLLISGDHVLYGITPNISLWDEAEDPLKQYLASLDKLIPLEVALVLPAHKRIFSNLRARIDEIKRHHEDRLSEVLTILGEGEQSAYQVASQVSWDTQNVSWKRLPYMQRYFSLAEALAHIRHLEARGQLRRGEREGKVVFSLNNC